MKCGLRKLRWIWAAIVLGCSVNAAVMAQGVVPGSGQKLPQVGDDFEDGNWSFTHNMPKSSEEIDEQTRYPTGSSTNGRWYEGIKRGQPDYMKVVPTPEGGLSGSTGSLLMRTLYSGIPGRLSNEMQQDDLVINCQQRLRTAIAVTQSPSAVVRVYLPPFDQWENRNGPSLGIRLALDTHAWVEPEKKKNSFFRPMGKEFKTEVYWPGMFIHFRSSHDGRYKEDSAYVTVRGNLRGADMKGPEIKTVGWWTFGMSCTPDGQVHFYARPGVDDLTEQDHITSQLPYSYKAEHFRTLFFNVCNQDDGKTWSTPWIIDDPSIYVNGTTRIAQRSK